MITNKHDIELINEAKTVHFTENWKVYEMIDKAETEEARKELHHIYIKLYRDEEYSCGCY